MIYVHSFLTRAVKNYWNVPSTQEFECVFPFKLHLLLLILAFSEYFIHVIQLFQHAREPLPPLPYLQDAVPQSVTFPT